MHRLARVFFFRKNSTFQVAVFIPNGRLLKKRPNAGRPGAERQWTACNKHPRLPHSYSLQCLGFSPHDSHPQTRHPASFCKKEPHTRTSAEGATTVRIMANSLTKKASKGSLCLTRRRTASQMVPPLSILKENQYESPVCPTDLTAQCVG